MRADSIHYGAHIVHPLFQCRHVADPVRQTGAALIEHDQTSESGEPGLEMHESWFVPIMIEIRYEARHPNEVERSIPDDLIGDPHIAAPRVLSPHRRHHIEPHSVPSEC